MVSAFSPYLIMKKFFATNDRDFSALLLRFGAGAAMVPFGLAKFGLVGEGSLSGTIEMLGGMGIPSFITILVSIAELVGAASLIAGFCTRFCAGSLAVVMAGAVYYTYGMGYAAGFAVPLLFVITYVPLVISGAGALSADSLIAKKLS